MKHNVLVGASNFTNLVYADDTTLLPSADDASARLSSFTEATAPLDLIISWAKTKLQNLHSGMAPNSISVNSSNIESVEDFIYLRRLQSSNGCCSQDLKRRTGLASSVMASLHQFGRISVSRSPLSCRFMRLWFCLYWYMQEKIWLFWQQTRNR